MPALGPPGALSPRDWNAIVDYDQWRDLFSPDDGVALHHGGGSDYAAGRTPYSRAREIQQLQQWEGYHIYSKGWRGLAYGWGVGQTGTIYRIRGWATYGAHTGDVDGDGIANNVEIVPIIFIGSGNHHDLSPAAQASIETLREFIEEGSPRATRLYGHQELKGTSTTCPGPKGMAYVTADRLLELENLMPLLPIVKGDSGEDVSLLKKLLNDVYGESLSLWPISYDSATASAVGRRLARYSNAKDVEKGEFVNGLMFAGLLTDLAQKHSGSSGSHDHDGRYVKNVTVSK